MTSDPPRQAGPSMASLTSRIDAMCDRFEQAWRDGNQPRIEDFLADETLRKGPTRQREFLIELVKVDLEWRWKPVPVDTISAKQASESTPGTAEVHLRSEPRLEHYCERYPDLGSADQLPDEVIVTEYRVRHRWGDKPTHDEYQQRFSGKSEALVHLLKQIDLAWANEAAESAASGEPGTRGPLKPITLDQFLQNIEDSGLMDVEEVFQFQESLPPEAKPSDGQTLAERLVQAEKLTPYQAEQVCEGEVLAFDEYVILDQIGAGGMGQVLKAEHRSMQRLVALKMISPKLVESPEAVKRFHREVWAAAKLIHPNIVVAHDAREHVGRHCLVMEYVDGQDLGKTVKQEGPLPVGTTVDYIIQAARGLAYAHDQGIIHRDIKPGNLLLDRRGTVKILDMGLARMDDTTEDEPDSDRLTSSSQTMGTCDYMAPEQSKDTRSVDHRADIYSLGCTLYRLLTGKRPYSGAAPMQVYVAHREDPIPSLCETRDDVPRELDAVFRKMVAKKPDDRQQSMAEVIEELQPYITEEDRRLRPIRRLNVLWAIGGPSLVLALFTGLVMLFVDGPGKSTDPVSSVPSTATIKTTVAPDLAVMPKNQGGSSNHLFLFFKGHDNDHICHAMLGPDSHWRGLGPINDDRLPTGWAYTEEAPCAINDSDPSQARFGLRLVFRSHEDNRIWRTRMTWHSRNNAAPHTTWESLVPFPASVATEHSPSACLHPWDQSESSLTVVYLETTDGMGNAPQSPTMPRVRLVREFDAEPIELQTPDGEFIRSRWSNRPGPVVASFNSRLHVFLRGVPTSGARLEYVRSTTNDFGTVRFKKRGEMSGIRTDLQPAVTVHNDTLLMAFKGHTNDLIWLTRLAVREGRENWENLQYVPGVETETAPALASFGDRLYLAFKPRHSDEIAVGTLVLGAGKSDEDPGHVWQPLR